MKRGLVAFVFLCAALSLLIATPALSAGKKLGLENFAPVPKTGQTESYYIGDDGDLEKGVPWPDPRFVYNGDGTVKDKLTGLVWMKNASDVGAVGFGPKNWADACSACNELESGENGLTDDSSAGAWRLPNVRELQSLIDYGQYNPALPSVHPFEGVQSSFYWSSTSNAGAPATGAWHVVFDYGVVNDLGNKGNAYYYVWCVRGGQ